jgi:hypothetical protein
VRFLLGALMVAVLGRWFTPSAQQAMHVRAPMPWAPSIVLRSLCAALTLIGCVLSHAALLRPGSALTKN